MTINQLHRLQAMHAVLPHLRFGQLLLNAASSVAGPHAGPDSTVLFHLPDEALVLAVEQYVSTQDKL